MKNSTIASLISGAPVALSAPHATMHLVATLPADTAHEDHAAVVIERGERFAVSRGVAVVPLRGLLTPNFFVLERYLGWSTYHGIEATANELAANEDVAAIVLEVDSPGGLVLGIEAASEAIARLAAVKPVHALVNPMAASAAYFVASQASDIAMTPGSIVGSVGTAVSDYSHQKPDMHGNRWFDVTSSHARAKWPDPATDEGMAETRRRLDEAEARFHAAVAAGRGIDPDDLPARLSVTDDVHDGGAVFAPSDAIARGLADTRETREAFYARIFAAHAPKPRAASRAYLAQAEAALAISQI